jgi:O-antigen ligase
VALSSSAARVRAWLALAVVAQFVALMLTMTRGAWVGVVAGLVVVCIVLRSRVLALASALGLAALLVFSSLYANDQGRTIAVSELVTSEADRNVSTRLVLWDMSWDMFRDHPLFGVGMGDYSLEAEARLAQRKVRTTVDSHNVFLQVLATRGLVGFLPFAAFFAVLVRSLWSIAAASERGSLARHYAAGALGATAAILAGALTENNVDDSEVFIALMFLVGVARSALYPPAAGERA